MAIEKLYVARASEGQVCATRASSASLQCIAMPCQLRPLWPCAIPRRTPESDVSGVRLFANLLRSQTPEQSVWTLQSFSQTLLISEARLFCNIF